MEETLLLGRYKILEKLAEGGFAEVYKAFDTRMERVVAIKKIPASPKTAPRALREAKTVALLNHPHIVTLHEFEETDEGYYLIMEYIEGVSLSQVLQAKSPLEVDEALAIAIQVCHALEYAHNSEVIHRDIKPANLMLLPDGRVKVTDFGIAKLKSAPLTREGTILGTFAYMSPEQASGELVEELTDIFSLGAVLYELLTGETPFKTETGRAALFKILHHEPEPPSKINPKVPTGLDNVVMKALSKNPADRYPTAVDMRYKLERRLKSKLSPQKIVKPLGSLVAEAEEVEILPTSTWATFKVRLWQFIGEHKEIVKRTVAAAGLAAFSWLALSRLPFYPQALTTLIPAATFPAILLFPQVGIGLAFVLLLLPILKHSLALGILVALSLIGYWAGLVRKEPTTSLIPLAAPFLARFRLSLSFPLLVGFLSRPLLAALLAGLGCLFAELYQIFSGVRVLGLVEITSTSSLWASLTGTSNPIEILAAILKSFAENPVYFLQPLLWALAAATVSVIGRTRRLSTDFLATAAGLAILITGSSSLPKLVGWPAPSTPTLMQDLSFSLIMLLLFFSLTPYGYLREGKKEPKLAENK